MNDPACYLLCYDIANPRRLQKVHRACCKLGTPYQYSVFCIQGKDTLDMLIGQLQTLIDPDEDDVRAYRFAGPETITLLGQQLLPGEILFL